MNTDWHPLGAILYRKWGVYDMQWDERIRLENFYVCGAPFGGPIALIADERKVAATEQFKSKLMIVTSAGKLLAEIEWNEKQIIGMGWSDQEHLIVVQESGTVKIFDIHGKLITTFLLLEFTSTSSVIECHFWGNGVAVITSEMEIFVAEGLSSSEISIGNKRPRTYSLRTGLGPDRTYTSMAIVPPLLSRSGLLEILIGTSDNSVLVIHESENEDVIEDQFLQTKISSPITKIAVAPNGRFLACYRKDGVLTVLSSAFTTKVLDFETKSISRPIEIAWCGEDSVVMQWRNTGIVMVGPFGDWLNFPYDVAVHLVAEPDCCRIVTSTGCEILQRVPPCTVAIRSVGSTDPAALMFDAMEAFEEGDPKSDENIRSVAAANQLGDAVLACVQAAVAEFDVDKQQSLLKAASYGKAFCPDADPNEFVDTARKLRVLNEVRKSDVGLPITIQQYNRLTPEVLVGRLTARNFHFLALRICSLLKLKNERVLVHWACEKVRRMSLTQATDEDINKVIKKQLEPYGRVSYLAIAETAYNMGRRRLATFILDKEQHAGDQIPLLLKMKEEELALQKAINSEDTDLIYYTLISLEARSAAVRDNAATFYRTIHSHLEAANLLKIYYRNKVSAEDRTVLHNLLMYSKNFFEAGVAAANQALLQQSLPQKTQLLKETAQLFGQGKDCTFYKAMTDDQLELMEWQRNLEIRCSTKKDFVDLTLHNTIEELIMLGLEDEGDVKWTEQEISKLAKKFKVSEKVVWHLKIACMCRMSAWPMLAKLASEKKSPVGYKPFANACIK